MVTLPAALARVRGGPPRRGGRAPATWSEGRVHRLPLLALLGELRPALGGDRVVLTAPAALGDFPPRLDVSEPLESVQNGVEHSVRPFHASFGELPNALEDRVAVAVLFPSRMARTTGVDEAAIRPLLISTLYRGVVEADVEYMAALYIGTLCIRSRFRAELALSD